MNTLVYLLAKAAAERAPLKRRTIRSRTIKIDRNEPGPVLDDDREGTLQPSTRYGRKLKGKRDV